MNYIIGILMVRLVVASQRVDLPDNFEKCPCHSATLEECISEAVGNAVRSMAEGYSEFDILPLEPLRTNDLSIKHNDRVLSIKLDYKNSEIHGLCQGLKIRYKPTRANLRTLRASAHHDRIDFVGDYAMDGKLSTIPISGTGRANVTMFNVTTLNTMHCRTYEKDDVEHLRVKKYEIELSPEKVHFQFDNLSSSSNVIRKPINDILNENSKMFFDSTMKGAFEKKLASIFKDVANKICHHVPISQFFPE